MAAAPRYRTQAWRDIGIGALRVTVWICSWFALTVATLIAGGDPSVSPVAFINPGALVRRFASGMGPLQWWVLVKPTSTVVVWKFWAALSLIVGTVTVGVIGTRMQLARLASSAHECSLPGWHQAPLDSSCLLNDALSAQGAGHVQRIFDRCAASTVGVGCSSWANTGAGRW
jgi:hypothetical protein